jgi:uncharacterized membrane protein YkvA (DUF1232 family)
MIDNKTVVGYWARRPTVFVRQLGRLVKDPDCPRWLGPVVLVTVAYLAFPFDLLPDFIPIVGQLDDVLLVAGIGALLRWAIPRQLAHQYFIRPVSESSSDEEEFDASCR